MVSNLCVGDDRDSILRCMRGLGARIKRLPYHVHDGEEQEMDCFLVRGRGPQSLREPPSVLNAGNSGTTMRLVTGLLAAQPFFSVLSGDRSLRRRPMDRIIRPLTHMGARISARGDDRLAPIAVKGGDLRGIEYELPVASAQLKSSLLIAGLHAQGETTVISPASSRDHTERMMKAMGADIAEDGLQVTVRRSRLRAANIRVPGDISGAAFWMVAAACHPNARLRIRSVGINQSRTGVIEVLESMGARIHLENEHDDLGEPAADIVVESSDLNGVEIAGDLIPRVIDEIPVLALAACYAKGTTIIRDASELRVKESDRISATVDGLTRLGADIEELEDGMLVRGGRKLTGTTCRSHGDHRIAMTMGIAGLLADGETTVLGADDAAISYPSFWDTIKALTA
jgi:3-phosphoshikimate 1-carboxyvinyltransferase